ncbi:MAG: hypothetical protein O3B76_08190 [Proteobacteria bacterium]|nr:hypothetical protein [Pseudomonadota bacterium]MDA1023466.1 hypothetical protein [Pseudomonadota bacterium]
MSDISAISAGRAAALRNEARFQRNQQEQTRVRQDEERRVAAQRQARAVQEQNALRARRVEDAIDARTQLNAERRDNELGNLTLEDEIQGRRDFIRNSDADAARLLAQQRDADAARPRLTPQAPVTDLSVGRFEDEGPPPLPPSEPSVPALTADEILQARQGPLAPPQPLPDVGPLDPFTSIEETVSPVPADFAIQERDRNTRIAERREDERSQDFVQEGNLEQANNRIAQTTQADPNLPRGSIVNVLG